MGYTYTSSISINASPEKIWLVLVDPEAVKKYYFGMAWETDWQKGSPIAFIGEWDRQPFRDKGFILDVQPGSFLQFSYFNAESGKQDVPENYTEMRYELHAQGSGCVFTVFQYGFNNPSEFTAVESKWNSLLWMVKELAEQ